MEIKITQDLLMTYGEDFSLADRKEIVSGSESVGNQASSGDGWGLLRDKKANPEYSVILNNLHQVILGVSKPQTFLYIIQANAGTLL